MKLSYLFTALLSLFLFSCKTQLTVRNATWHNWSGGQPGVGGTNYKIVLNNKKQKEFALGSLAIDGTEVSPDVVKVDGDSILIIVIENKSQAPRTPENPNPKRPEFRKENPTNATLTGTLDSKPVKLEIGSFEKVKSINYQ